MKLQLKPIERPEWWRLATVAAVVGLVVWFSITLTRKDGNVAFIWLSNAALLGILLKERPQYWIAYMVTAFVANFVADRLYGDSTMLALGIAACNMTEVILAAELLRSRLTDAGDLSHRRALMYFLLYGVIAAPAVSALLGAALIKYITGASFPTVLKTWYMADAMGIALVTPLILSLRQHELAQLFGREMIAKTLGILALVVAATIVVFTESAYPLRIIMFPVLMLVIFELGFTGTAIAICLIAAFAILFTIEGSGPMMAYSELTPDQRIFFVQITIVTMVLVALPMTVILSERKRLSAELERMNTVLHDLAMTDGLTGLANRRHFDEMLEREWRRTARESGVLSLLLLDIDHFKPFNDHYGHLSGDECLKKVSHSLAKIARRSGDICARFGGEEFGVILPNTDTQQAMSIAESMRAAIKAMEIKHEKVANGQLTVSVGVASIKPRDPHAKISGLVEAADRALYNAKRAGRNRTMTA